VVVGTVSHVHAAVHCSPGPHRSAPDGELGSHASSGSTTPLPHSGGAVVVVVVVVVASVVDVDASVVVVVVSVVLVVVGASVVVVVATGTHVHAAVHSSSAGHRSAPDGELKSQSSPGSTTPLPHVVGVVFAPPPHATSTSPMRATAMRMA
jgi:hypothetical protein